MKLQENKLVNKFREECLKHYDTEIRLQGDYILDMTVRDLYKTCKIVVDNREKSNNKYIDEIIGDLDILSKSGKIKKYMKIDEIIRKLKQIISDNRGMKITEKQKEKIYIYLRELEADYNYSAQVFNNMERAISLI